MRNDVSSAPRSPTLVPRGRSVAACGGVLVTALPLWAVAFARPLLDGAGQLWRWRRVAAWHQVEGRHYQYRQHPLEVREDAQRRRYLRLSRVRGVLRDLARDEVLARRYPQACLPGAEGLAGTGLWLEDAALMDLLAPAQDPATRRFRARLQREVLQPGQRVRGAPVGFNIQ